MSKVSRESAPDITDYGPAEDRGAHFDGYAVVFTSVREDWDLTPLLKGSPGDSCQCPHWGYVTAGRLTVRYGDHEEVMEPGHAFYMPPGHVPAVVAGTELVMFSPQDELAAAEAAMREAMQLRMQKGEWELIALFREVR
jgi:quercetin dioxygenase-like cupin family protein